MSKSILVFTVFLAVAGASPLAAAQTSEEASGARFTPATGFMLQGRVLGYVGGSSGSAIGLYAPGGPGAAIGYRGRGWSLGFSPSYTSVAVSTAFASGGEVSAFGLTIMLEYSLAHALAGRAELNLVGGAGTALYTEGGIDPGLGAFLGLGGRYWVSRALGLGVSFGESYASATGTSGGARVKAGTFATFGAIDVTFVLGG